MAASREGRFASLTDQEFESILENKNAENTKKATKQAVTLFREYLREKGLPSEFESLDKPSLATTLGKFYVEARRVNGEHYKRATLNSIRSGINRHLKREYSELIDIIKDTEFAKANDAYKAATVELKKVGKGNVQHHDSIDQADIQKLYDSGIFDLDSPSGLQDKVWFELMLFICRRGRENLRELKKDHFVIETSSSGRQYVKQAVDELTKKAREDNMESRADNGRMYETGDENCPVASFKKYVAKLNPECDSFFQAPKLSAPSSGPWYKRCPVGKNSLGTTMSRLSKKAGLSKIYTNHCVRATCISILDNEGFENRDICQVSGHSNESSLASYTGRVSEDRKQQMSDALLKAIGQRVPQPKSPPASTSTRPSTSRARPAVENQIVHHASETESAMESEEDINFDIGFSPSQLSEVSVTCEEVVHDERVTNVLQPVSGDNVNRAQTVNIANRSTRTRSTTTSSTTRQTMMSPFVLNNCTVTINYYNSQN